MAYYLAYYLFLLTKFNLPEHSQTTKFSYSWHMLISPYKSKPEYIDDHQLLAEL